MFQVWAQLGVLLLCFSVFAPVESRADCKPAYLQYAVKLDPARAHEQVEARKLEAAVIGIAAVAEGFKLIKSSNPIEIIEHLIKGTGAAIALMDLLSRIERLERADSYFRYLQLMDDIEQKRLNVANNQFDRMYKNTVVYLKLETSREDFAEKFSELNDKKEFCPKKQLPMMMGEVSLHLRKLLTN